MLRKSLETLDEKAIADTLGMKTIRYRLAPKLVEVLHPKVARAFEQDILGKASAMEMACVKPPRQATMLTEMKRVNDFSPAFIRALILKTPQELRKPKDSRSLKTACPNASSCLKLLRPPPPLSALLQVTSGM
jgi:hypothetical protein